MTLFTENDQLPLLIHSIKARVKHPDHLRDKLLRKLNRSYDQKVDFDISTENLFEKINDLAGIRLLHLHTSQISDIDRWIRHLLDQEMYVIVQGPFARTWDDEYREFFTKAGIQPETSQSLYTSVHYVVQPTRKAACTAEIQVRTLAEELWGEVDHSINYPYQTESLACQEELKVLARITSSCTRLVDAIFKSRDEHRALKPQA
jgi:ppGpp synthetase/RelA/SpoT-type nucleotidyltranferase